MHFNMGRGLQRGRRQISRMKHRRARLGVQGTGPNPASGCTLAGVEPGREVAVLGFANLPAEQRQRLQAFGLLPGRRVRVLSRNPLIIVQVEQTELAIEVEIAAGVLVEERAGG